MRGTLIYSFSLFIIFLSSCKDGQDSIRVFPKGFEGHAIIIFDEEKGKELVIEEGKRLYQFPESGVVISKADENYGPQTHQYFFETDKSERRGIAFISAFNYDAVNKSETKIAFHEIIVGKSGNRPAYKVFTIGKGKDIQKWIDSRNDFVEKVFENY
ncbi:MAG: hypothetical protein AAGK97_04510 [Bacteroidota bacterium]